MASFFKTQIDLGEQKAVSGWIDFSYVKIATPLVSDTKRLELRCRAPLIIILRVFLVIMGPPKKQKKCRSEKGPKFYAESGQFPLADCCRHATSGR